MVPLWDQLSAQAHPAQKQKRGPARIAPMPRQFCVNANSAAQAQARDQRLITLGVLGLHIVEQAAALATPS